MSPHPVDSILPAVVMIARQLEMSQEADAHHMQQLVRSVKVPARLPVRTAMFSHAIIFSWLISPLPTASAFASSHSAGESSMHLVATRRSACGL
jgi:hypothetical protein